MIKNKKFHELIEQQDKEAKERNLQQLKITIDTSENCCHQTDNGKNVKLLLLSPKVFLPVLFFIIIAIVAVLLVILLPRKGQERMRFCSQQDYTSEVSDLTLKDYSSQNNGELLYFDWYDKTEFYNDYVIKLNDTGEIICYQEIIYDISEGYVIYIYITDDKTEIDFLNHYKTCDKINFINGVEVKFTGNDDSEFATFTFKKFKYYVDVLEAESSDVLLSYIEQLLII